MKIKLPDPCVCAHCGSTASRQDVLDGKSGRHYYLMWMCDKCTHVYDKEVAEEIKNLPF